MKIVLNFLIKFTQFITHNIGERCCSNKQKNGTNGNKSKKRYLPMVCIFCKEFLPDTPWAKVRARKYESGKLQMHERSQSHKKSVSLIEEKRSRKVSLHRNSSERSSTTSESFSTTD